MVLSWIAAQKLRSLEEFMVIMKSNSNCHNRVVMFDGVKLQDFHVYVWPTDFSRLGVVKAVCFSVPISKGLNHYGGRVYDQVTRKLEFWNSVCLIYQLLGLEMGDYAIMWKAFRKLLQF